MSNIIEDKNNYQNIDIKNDNDKIYINCSIVVLLLCIFDITINIYTLIPIQYNEATNIVNINCNSTYLTNLIISYCPNYHNKCYFPSPQWNGFQMFSASLDGLIILIIIINIISYIKYNIINKREFKFVFMCMFFPLIISIIFYTTSTVNYTNDYKCEMVNSYCDEINKYCDEYTRISCNTTKDFITFDYRMTDVIDKFTNKMSIFKYLYYPIILIMICFGNVVQTQIK